MFDGGERQVAPDVSGIRRDHVARYEWAANLLPAGARILDAACGIGYGSSILAKAGFLVTGVDRNEEALNYAEKHYAHAGISQFVIDDLSSPADIGAGFDAVVCFETIEHIADPLPMLRAFHKAAPRLLASVPNEDCFPFTGQKFHQRHYTRAQFRTLLEQAGWKITGWFGQEGPESEVGPDVRGRTVIITAERADGSPSAELRVDHVAIVALGPSSTEYFEVVKNFGGRNGLADEVWAINAMGNCIACDRIFHMDDVLVQEARAKLDPSGNIAKMLDWLRVHPGPIYTSAVRPGYPGLVPFPLQDVINQGGVPYLNNTVAYAIAYARFIGVRKISLYGVDFTYANRHKAERGRACCEFWLGLCTASGMEIWMPEGSSLMDACAPAGERLYGYDGFDVVFNDGPEGKLALEFNPVELPSGEEMDRRYDHTKHPNRLMENSHG